MIDDNLIKQTLDSAKTIAMIGASAEKEKDAIAKSRLKPSIIVMKYKTKPRPAVKVGYLKTPIIQVTECMSHI